METLVRFFFFAFLKKVKCAVSFLFSLRAPSLRMRCAFKAIILILSSVLLRSNQAEDIGVFLSASLIMNVCHSCKQRDTMLCKLAVFLNNYIAYYHQSRLEHFLCTAAVISDEGLRLQLEAQRAPSYPQICQHLPARESNMIPRFYGTATARLTEIRAVDRESLGDCSSRLYQLSPEAYAFASDNLHSMVCLSPKAMLFKSPTPKLEEKEKTHPHGNTSKFIEL